MSKVKQFSDLKFFLWLSAKLLFNKKFLFGGSGPLSLFGLILGVAALVPSQSVMRGFEHTLQKAVIDMTGDIQIQRRGALINSWDDFEKEVRELEPSIQKMMRFADMEAVVASQGKVSGVLVKGMDMQEAAETLSFQQRFLEGGLPKDKNEIAVGTGLAKKLSLSLGHKIYVAVPLSTPFESTSFKRRAEEFTVVGILDMGKNDWNERLVISHIKDLQNLALIGDRVSGGFIRIADSHQAVNISAKMAETLEPRYYINNWYNLNRNVLEAAGLEKIVIFFVVFLIVVMAAFNISSTLYIFIRSRYKDIAILKTLGFNSKAIKSIFVLQGFVIGTVGTMGGFIVGIFLSYGFMWLQATVDIIPGAVYHIDRIDIDLSIVDFIVIYVMTLAACMLASYYPAKKGSELLIVDGMKKD